MWKHRTCVCSLYTVTDNIFASIVSLTSRKGLVLWVQHRDQLKSPQNDIASRKLDVPEFNVFTTTTTDSSASPLILSTINPRERSLSSMSRKELVLDDPSGPVFKSLSLSSYSAFKVKVKVKVNVDLYSALSWTHLLRRSAMARVLKGSLSFICTPRIHPLTEWTISAFSFPAEAGHLLTPEGWKAEWAWMAGYIPI